MADSQVDTGFEYDHTSELRESLNVLRLNGE